MRSGRKLAIGLEVRTGEGSHQRVWAPGARKVEVVRLDSSGTGEILAAWDLKEGLNGYFEGWTGLQPGDWYKIRLNQGAETYPDPASRFQPRGPHGASEVVDPSAFRWTDREWRGVTAAQNVVYEVHIGTWTEAGTWRAAMDRLAELARLGVTLIEVMPVAEFPGRFGWGYDGVSLFAPYHGYGTPEDMRRLWIQPIDWGWG